MMNKTLLLLTVLMVSVTDHAALTEPDKATGHYKDMSCEVLSDDGLS
jgi:hypothetical protein